MKLGGGVPVAGEAGIEVPVRPVAGDGEAVGAHEDAAVTLHGDRLGSPSPKDLPVPGGVPRPVGEQAGDE